MSGTDEQQQLWILQYEEYLNGYDWITCFRGIFAKTEEEAKQKASIWIDCQNANSSESDEKDYLIVKIFKPTHECHSFIICDFDINWMRKRNERE